MVTRPLKLLAGLVLALVLLLMLFEPSSGQQQEELIFSDGFEDGTLADGISPWEACGSTQDLGCPPPPPGG